MIAVATFKKIAKIQVSEIDYLYKEDDNAAVELGIAIDKFFDCDNEQERTSM